MNRAFDMHHRRSAMRESKTCILILTLLMTCAVLVAFTPLHTHATGINHQLYYQGILEDTSGNTVANGSHDMVFKLYDAATGGTLLWTGTHTAANGNAVTTTDGIFTVLLGSGTGNSLASFDFNQDTLYLGITVGSDSEMTPRQRVASAAYAFNADKLDGLDASSFLTTTGGNLGLGTTTSASAARLTLQATSTQDILNLFETGGSEVFTVLESGNVGIGTVAPTSLLEISSGTAGDAELTLSADTDNSNESDNPAIILTQDGGAGRSYIALEGLAGTRSSSTLANALIIGGETSQTAVQLITNDAARLTVDLSGNVGIGTTSPSEKLHVHDGELRFSHGTEVRVEYEDTGATAGSRMFAHAFQEGLFYFQDVSDSGGFEKNIMVLQQNSGNVGIGTDSPATKLHVEGALTLASTTPATTTQALYAQGSTLYWDGSAVGSGASLWSQNGSDVYYSSGNVGIGTASPTHQFQVYGASAGIRLTRTSNEPFIWLDTNQSGASSGGQLRGISGGGIRFTNGTGGSGIHEWMRLTSTGDVGIGTPSPARQLHVSTSADEPPVRFQDSSGYCEINPTTTTWTCTSDETLKTNVLTLESTLADVLALNPVNFDWESEGVETRERGERYGLIAQEVEKHFPHLVTTDPDTGLKSVAYGGLTIPLLKATQEIAAIADPDAPLESGDGTRTFVGRFFDRLVAWFADAGNGIGTLFADEVHTGTLCLTKADGNVVCLTAEDIERIGTAVNDKHPMPVTPDAGGQAGDPPPTITLEGNNPAVISVGDTYGDLGVIAKDWRGYDLSIALQLDGVAVPHIDIDTSTPATYIVTYTAIDTNHQSTNITRTIIIEDDTTTQSATTTATTATPTNATTTPPTQPADTTPPTITLNGDSEVALIVGDTYTEDGATATDDTDGDLTDAITITGSVDTATAGTYTLTYAVSDTAGNSATATRTVVVEAAPQPDPPQPVEPTAQLEPQAQPDPSPAPE